jgi:hypothetical protein
MDEILNQFQSTQRQVNSAPALHKKEDNVKKESEESELSCRK